MCANTNREQSLLNKELVRRHFNRHAYEYDEFAKVQLDMGNRLLEMVEQYNKTLDGRGFTNILEIGCGTGNVTLQLLEQYPQAQYTAFDIAASMIEHTKDNLGDKAERVHFIASDAEELGFPKPSDSGNGTQYEEVFNEQFDLIISNATFQWFNYPLLTVRRYLEQLSPRGLFLFSTFAPRTFYELHESFSEAHILLGLEQTKHGQSFLSEERWRDIFGEPLDGTFVWQEESRVEKYKSVREFMHSIKRIGAGNAIDIKRGSGEFTGRRLLSAMEQSYRKNHSIPDGVRATYQLGFGIYFENKNPKL
ncbi:MAG TPA: malonyl-ACP O-methyltransferase BioC [Bacilli bacterium]